MDGRTNRRTTVKMWSEKLILTRAFSSGELKTFRFHITLSKILIFFYWKTLILSSFLSKSKWIINYWIWKGVLNKHTWNMTTSYSMYGIFLFIYEDSENSLFLAFGYSLIQFFFRFSSVWMQVICSFFQTI